MNLLRELENFTIISSVFIKPGIQERGTEFGECGERRECSLRFQGIS